MLRAQIAQAVMMMTGMVPGPDGNPGVVSAGGANVTNAGTTDEGGTLPGTAVSGPEIDTMNKLVQRAYGARFAQRRVPDEE